MKSLTSLRAERSNPWIATSKLTLLLAMTLCFLPPYHSAHANSGWIMLHCVGNKIPVSKVIEFKATNIFIKNDGSKMHMGDEEYIYQRVNSPINWVYKVDMKSEDMTHFKEFNPDNLTLEETIRLKGATVGSTSLVCQPIQNPFTNIKSLKD